jgi:hypothetical protein
MRELKAALRRMPRSSRFRQRGGDTHLPRGARREQPEGSLAARRVCHLTPARWRLPRQSAASCARARGARTPVTAARALRFERCAAGASSLMSLFMAAGCRGGDAWRKAALTAGFAIGGASYEGVHHAVAGRSRRGCAEPAGGNAARAAPRDCACRHSGAGAWSRADES